jgi:hypothetical protein
MFLTASSRAMAQWFVDPRDTTCAGQKVNLPANPHFRSVI